MKSYRQALVPAVVLIAMLFTSTVSAQTKKRPTRKVVPPVTTPTVVTQADVYTNQTKQIIEGTSDPLARPTPTPTPTVPETTDEKLDDIGRRLSELGQRMKSIESNRSNDYDEKQKRLLLNLDILTRAEQRSEALRKQLYEMIEKENAVKTRLEQLDFDLRPEMIDRQIAFAGTLRPEELREMRRKNLDVEKRNLQGLLTEIQATRSNLELNVQRSDQLVEKLRAKLEKDIDDGLAVDPR